MRPLLAQTFESRSIWGGFLRLRQSVTDKIEVRIVGDESDAQAAMRRAAQAVQDATQTMRTKLGEIQSSSRSAFGGMGREAKEGADEVKSSMQGIEGTLDKVRAHFQSFVGGFKQGWREADAEIRKARETTRQFQETTERATSGGKGGGGLMGALAVFKGGLMLEAVGKLKDLAVGAVETSAEFERLRSVLLTLEGSQAAANARFADLKKFATDTPYELSEVVTAFAKLKAQGLDPSNAALTSYGNTAAAMGKTLDDMVEAVADAAMGEYERLKEFGIKASDAGDHVVMNFKGQATEVKKNSADIQAYLQKIGNTDFAGAMARQMDTLGGKFSNLSDAAASFADQMGEGGLSSALKDAMDSMTGATGASGNLAAEIGQVLGVAVRTVTSLVKAFGTMCSDIFAVVKQIVTDTMGKSAGASITWGNTLHALGATLAAFGGIVKYVYTGVYMSVSSGINIFTTFAQVVNAALNLDFGRLTRAVEDGVNRQVDIVKTGMSRIKNIVSETKQSIGEAWKPVAGNTPATAPVVNTAIPGTNFGSKKGGGAGGRAGKGAGGGTPSEMDIWRTDLQDQVLEEEKAGRDTLQFVAEFWQKKLALTKAGSKQQLEVRRELTRAQIALGRSEDQETLAQIRDTQAMKMEAAQSDIELSHIALEEKLADIDAERQAGVLSEQDALRRRAQVNQQKLALDRQLEQRQYDIKVEALTSELKLYALGTREYAAHLRQLEILKRQHDNRVVLMNRQADLQQKRDDDALAASKRRSLDAWTQSWSQQIAKLVTLQQGFATTIKGIWNDMVGMFEQAIARMVQQWLIGLVTKEAMSTASQRKEVLKTAKEAAAGAYASIVKIPFIGPFLAPAAAAAAFAATVAFSAKDGYDVPAMAGPGIDGKGGQVGIVHPREMVLPAEIADKFRNGGMDGGAHLHLHGKIITGKREMEKWFKDNRSGVGAGIKDFVRQGGR
jgi:phage tail tape-measure protein